jgi:hypothetical protein
MTEDRKQMIDALLALSLWLTSILLPVALIVLAIMALVKYLGG